MEKKILIAGSGGQGIMLMGQMLGLSTQHEGLNVTFFPTYGPQQRGGTSSCRVVISDEPIYAPIPNEVDIFVVMNQEAYDKYFYRIKKNGTVLINSSEVYSEIDREDLNVLNLPADELAMEFGNIKFANMVMLGALVNLIEDLSIESLVEAMEEKMKNKPSFIDVNRTAIKLGASYFV